MVPCLFSSQVPLAVFLDGILKLVEVHQEFDKNGCMMSGWETQTFWQHVPEAAYFAVSWRILNEKAWSLLQQRKQWHSPHSLKKDKEQNAFSVHYLLAEFGTEWKNELFKYSTLQVYFKEWFCCRVLIVVRKTQRLAYSCRFNYWVQVVDWCSVAVN